MMSTLSIDTLPQFIGAMFMSACLMLCITNSMHAQVTPPDSVTAKDVVNDPSKLEDYLKWIVHDFKAPKTPIEGFLLQNRIHSDTTGIWGYENIFLVLLDATRNLSRGLIITHSGDRRNEGQNWLAANVTDEKGTKVVEKILSAGDEAPLLVEYHWDDPNDPNDNPETPKESLAMRYYSNPYGDSLTVVVGFAQPVPIPDLGDFTPQTPIPETQANQVVDRETLKIWATGLVDWVGSIMDQEGGFQYLLGNIDMWSQNNSTFRSGATYIVALSTIGQVLFHGQNPGLIDLTHSRLDSLDLRGQQFYKGFIDTAMGDSKEGFYEYWIDDPSIDGDEDSTAAPKVAFAKLIDREGIPGTFSDGIVVIGTSNITSATSVQELPTDTDIFTSGNYPNPFSRTTNLYFNLEEAADIEIEVVNLLGRVMLKSSLGEISRGIVSDYEIDSMGWAPGVYYYRIIATTERGPTIHSGKMMIVR